jgi:hypothetical protein
VHGPGPGRRLGRLVVHRVRSWRPGAEPIRLKVVQHQPATDPPHARPRPQLPFEQSGFVRWFRRASALVRWVVLVLFVGLGAAAVVAVTIAALITLAENA